MSSESFHIQPVSNPLVSRLQPHMERGRARNFFFFFINAEQYMLLSQNNQCYHFINYYLLLCVYSFFSSSPAAAPSPSFSVSFSSLNESASFPSAP